MLKRRCMGFTLTKILLTMPIAVILIGILSYHTNKASNDMAKMAQETKKQAVSKEYMGIIFDTYNKMRMKGELVDKKTTMTQLVTGNLKVKPEKTAKVNLPVMPWDKNPPVGDCAKDIALKCYRLPNGAILSVKPDTIFHKGENSGGHPYAMWVAIDPDGMVTDKTSTVDDTLSLVMVNDGRMYTTGNIPEVVTLYSQTHGETLLFPGDIPNPSWLKQ